MLPGQCHDRMWYSFTDLGQAGYVGFTLWFMGLGIALHGAGEYWNPGTWEKWRHLFTVADESGHRRPHRTKLNRLKLWTTMARSISVKGVNTATTRIMSSS
jgi:hypothetical protein